LGQRLKADASFFAFSQSGRQIAGFFRDLQGIGSGDGRLDFPLWKGFRACLN
jgi:hypothetical protein